MYSKWIYYFYQIIVSYFITHENYIQHAFKFSTQINFLLQSNINELILKIKKLFFFILYGKLHSKARAPKGWISGFRNFPFFEKKNLCFICYRNGFKFLCIISLIYDVMSQGVWGSKFTQIIHRVNLRQSKEKRANEKILMYDSPFFLLV